MGGPLRILHVVVNMNRGGAESLIMNLYRNIDRSKIQFDFLTSKQGVFDNEISLLGGRVHRIPYISEVGHIDYVSNLINFFRNNKEYLVVHSHLDKMSGLVLHAAKKAGVPIRISHSHSTNSEGNFMAKSYKWLIGKYIPENATNMMACSSKAAKWLFSNKEKEALIIKNGIELSKFTFSLNVRNDIRGELEIAEDCLVLGHVGRFSEPKNHFFLIDLFKEITSEYPNVKLLLVGEGPLMHEIKQRVSEKKLVDNVIFLGVRSDVERIYQSFDLFLFPSLYEGLPVALIEAQTSGLPCLVSDSVTKEVDLELGLVEFLTLDNKQLWINKIKYHYQMGFNKRISSPAFIKHKGYDIRDSSTQLQKFYLTVSR